MVCCSQRGCYQWNHVECERVDAQRVEQEKKFKCRACLQRNVANEDEEEVEKDIFFVGDWNGPPSASLDAALSGHHVVDCIRANRHVMLGDAVFPGDDMGAL